MPATYFRNKNILIISPESWSHLFVSKHNYAIELAKSNKVFFLNPPGAIFNCIETAYANICQINYRPFIRGLRYLPSFFQQAAFRRKFHEIEQKANIEFDCVWSFDNSVFFDFSALPERVLKISHLVDYSQNFQLSKAASTATICLGVSQNIVDRLKRCNEKSFLIPHGVSIQNDFGKDIELPGSNSVKAMYAGNLDSQYLDKALIFKLIRTHSTVDFIFLGSGGADWPQAGNLFKLGPVPHSELLNYFKKADILLLVYDAKKFPQQLTNAHKILEYLASGKVIVSNFISDYNDGADVLSMADPEGDISSVFADVILKLPDFNSVQRSNRRIDFAMKNTYARRIEEIEDLIYNYYTKLNRTA